MVENIVKTWLNLVKNELKWIVHSQKTVQNTVNTWLNMVKHVVKHGQKKVKTWSKHGQNTV